MSDKTCFAFEKITLSDKVERLNAEHFAPTGDVAKYAFITCEGAIRYRLDEIDPTNTDGHLLQDGDYLELEGELQLRRFKAINVDNILSILQVSYER